MADAVEIFAAVVTIGCERYEDVGDGSEVVGSFSAAGRGLIRCLARQSSLAAKDRLTATSRATLIDAVYVFWLFTGDGYWEDELGENPPAFAPYLPGALRPQGQDITKVLAAALTAEELHGLDQRWRAEAMNTNNPEPVRCTAIEFGLALVGPERQPLEATLQLLERAGLWDDVIHLFLRLGRLPEAIAVADRHLTAAIEVTLFADEVWKAGPAGQALAIRFVDERANAAREERERYVYLTWLVRAHERVGDLPAALEVHLRLFAIHPDSRAYAELKRLVNRQPGGKARWLEMRAAAIQTLITHNRAGEVISIYLEEGEVAAAIALYEEVENRPRKASGFDLYGSPLAHYRANLAAAGERDFPDFSLRIYLKLAEQEIAFRTRANYASAAGHLVSVKRVLTAMNRPGEWPPLIAKIRADHKILRVLQEELTRAGAI